MSQLAEESKDYMPRENNYYTISQEGTSQHIKLTTIENIHNWPNCMAFDHGFLEGIHI